MRIRSLFLSMVIGLAFVGCSSEEDITSGNNGGELGEPQFLTVSLVTNSTNGTRAAGDQVQGDPNQATYEEGLVAENEVSMVRFYFFNEDGTPAKVRKAGDIYYNYLDWKEISNEGTDMPNVEKILNATLVIQSPNGDKEPNKIVAIINPVEDANEGISLTSLADIAGNYQTKTQKGAFVMSNSTYAKNNNVQMAVSVDGKLHKTATEAKNDPVSIYVERTVAKVRLNSGLTAIAGQPNTFKTSADGSQKFGDKEIFVRFLGWNTTAVADKSRLVKKINPAWPNNLFGGSLPWNWDDYYRSFWAINASNVAYQYGAFQSNDAVDNLFQAQAKEKFDKSEWVYVNENATDNEATGADPATRTKVIIAAQLVDQNGEALEFAQYREERTTIKGLKTLFANNCGLYQKTVDEKGTHFTKITANDLEIKTATAVGEADKDHEGRYKVYIQLTADAEKITWYPSSNQNAQELTTDQANDVLKDLGAAQVWKNGYTYYYFDIKHLGNKIGVVRNHIYDAKITSLAGLGTPVYDPNEIIYPEKPTDDPENTFIAAQINILSWRVVSNDYSLDW